MTESQLANYNLALDIRYKLFADRPTVNEALEYAFRVIKSMGPNEEVAATTALMVVLNTVANQILKNEGLE